MPKPDDRSDNVEKLQNMIQNTEENIAKSQGTLERTSSPEAKAEIESKNQRREESLESLRAEVKDEANDQQYS